MQPKSVAILVLGNTSPVLGVGLADPAWLWDFPGAERRNERSYLLWAVEDDGNISSSDFEFKATFEVEEENKFWV